MSYSRFSNADVYVYMDARGTLDCCGCILQKSEWVEDPGAFFGFYLRALEPIIETRFTTTQQMVDHLSLHRAAGHDVPDGIEADLWADDQENWN